LKASSAYHPESDGQTEIVNAYMEQYLRAFCSFYQDDWADWLPLGEFASNNQVSETTGVSPFFANYGWNPSMGTEPTGPPTAADTPAQQKEFHNATTVADRVQAVTEHVKSLAEASRRRYEEAANRHREDAGSFEVGDLVWISTKNMASSRPTDKLNERWIGPFPVTKVYRRALAVELPEQYRVFPVFHLSLVQRHQQGFPGQEAANEEYDRRNAGVVLTDHPDQNPETEWYFDAITNSRLTPDGDLEYRVKWPAPHAATWEPARNVEGADDKIYEFHKKNPSKPGLPEWWRLPE
jgi:hypothetical protein